MFDTFIVARSSPKLFLFKNKDLTETWHRKNNGKAYNASLDLMITCNHENDQKRDQKTFNKPFTIHFKTALISFLFF